MSRTPPLTGPDRPAVPSVPAFAGFHDAGHGYDRFGLHPPTVAALLRATRWLYERYFRVESQGVEHVPAQGGVILASNHSGVVPLDAFILGSDLLRRTGLRRMPRLVEERFVPLLPLFGTWFARLGAVAGTRTNVAQLLAQGELVVIFPEGVAGVRKRFRERYQLREWRVGHVELALRHRVPVVPACVVGAEEAWPLAARLDIPLFAGIPYLPLPMSPLPLPVRFHLRYGVPIDLSRVADGDPDNPATLRAGAARVRGEVERLLASTLAERRGVFQ